jgi:hypothetical protein
MLFIGCLITLLLSAFRGILFLAERCENRGEQAEEEEKEEKVLWPLNGTNPRTQSRESFHESDTDIASEVKKREELYIFSQKARLSWRLQYGGLAILFHASFIGWSSVAALLTIRSQRWLTR